MYSVKSLTLWFYLWSDTVCCLELGRESALFLSTTFFQVSTLNVCLGTCQTARFEVFIGKLIKVVKITWSLQQMFFMASHSLWSTLSLLCRDKGSSFLFSPS